MRPDSNTVRILGYVVVAVLLVLAHRREAARVGRRDGVWPAFWVWTCVFVLAMALGRAVEAGDVLASVGRQAARDRDWYESRRPLQAAVVGGVGSLWFVVVGLALWRTPERRRRYLPVGVMVLTLAAFAAVRVVSLHQVDALLHRTHVGGVRLGTIAEVTLLALTGVATFWTPPGIRRSADAHGVV